MSLSPNSQRQLRAESPISEPASERLQEPELACYLTLQRQQQAARVQAATWGQALQALVPLLSARYGLGPDDAIDADGNIRRGAAATTED